MSGTEPGVHAGRDFFKLCDTTALSTPGKGLHKMAIVANINDLWHESEWDAGKFETEARAPVVRSECLSLRICGCFNTLTASDRRSPRHNPRINLRSVYEGNVVYSIRENVTARSAIFNSAFFFFFTKRPLFRCRRPSESHKAVKRPKARHFCLFSANASATNAARCVLWPYLPWNQSLQASHSIINWVTS